MQWLFQEPVDGKSLGILSRHSDLLPPLLTHLIREGITEPSQLEAFLQPRLRDIEDPFAISHMREAVDRIRLALKNKESMVIVGDYDVDGVTSTTLLVSLLGAFGASPQYFIPRRMEEGYGLSQGAVDKAMAMEEDISLLIALDCGTNSVEEVAALKGQGIDVIIIDHHRCQENWAEQAILVNPHLFDPEDAPWKNFCTVGLVFKLAHALIKDLRQDEDPIATRLSPKEYLDLVAMGTVADLVPLRGENRTLARQGLEILHQASRPGIKALFEVSGMTLGDPVRPYDISFRLGPRINASGRLDDATPAIHLLLSSDNRVCHQLATELDGLNRERQEIERSLTNQAREMVETHFSADPGLVLYGEEWHPGVVGIVAGKLARDFNRPTIVLGKDNDQAKGSGRGVYGINILEALTECQSLLSKWGGHPMAVGVSMPVDNIEDFRLKFCQAIREQSHQITEPELPIAATLETHELIPLLFDQIESLQPFGEGNPEPIFALRNLTLSDPPRILSGSHCKFSIRGGEGCMISAIAWRMANKMPPLGQPFDVAVKLGWNEFRGNRYPQAQILDWKLSK